MSKALVIVDVQPAYRSNCNHIAKQVANRINSTRCPVIIYWVGEGLTQDTEDDVRCYLERHGAHPDRLDEARFIEKDYGFLREWMDWGVEPDVIIQTGRAMLSSGVNDTRHLDLASVLDEEDADRLPPEASLKMPAFDVKTMLMFDRVDICGGGADQCLAEMELVLGMHQKPFTRLEQLTY